jgi:hypothetical protein
MGARMTPVTDNKGKDDAVGNHKIRTTITPGEVLTVDDAVLLDLTRQGLVLSDAEVEKIEKAAQAVQGETPADKKKGE